MTDPVAEILVCDDDEDDLLLLQEALAESAPHPPVRYFQSGESLLLHLRDVGRRTRVVVVLLDLNMPGLGGREVLETLRAPPRGATTPVVIFTTSRAPEDVESSYRAGANSFVSKPASYAHLVRVVRSLSAYWVDVVTPPLAGAGS